MQSCGSRSSSWRIAEFNQSESWREASKGGGDRCPPAFAGEFRGGVALANFASTMARDDSWHETVRATAGRAFAVAIRVGLRVRGTRRIGLARARGRGIQESGVDHRPIDPQ